MLEPIQRSRQDDPPLVPNDLLVVQEADTQQTIENLAGEFAGVPHVAHLKIRQKFESPGPIGTRVP